MVSKSLEKTRVKGRKNRVTIEDKYLGPEPLWDEQNPQPTDESEQRSEWNMGSGWYNYFYKPKDYIPYILQYAQDVHGYTKKEAMTLKVLEDWKLGQGLSRVARLHYRGWSHTPEQHATCALKLKEYMALALTYKVEAADKKADAPVMISPAQRSYNTMMDTIHGDWDDQVVDEWQKGNFKADFDVYTLWKTHGLKGNIIEAFKRKLQFEYDLVSDAYNKKCDQAVEAYDHITRGNQKKMITLLDKVFGDLEKLKVSFKATKLPRATKVKASDAQIKNLQFKQEDIESKIQSINPVLIPGKEILFVYNTKYKALAMYVTTATKGFEVSGTSIKNFEPSLSKSAKLRKPDDILPEALKCTQKQMEKRVWDKLTTKISEPTGRINKDCVLLRVM